MKFTTAAIALGYISTGAFARIFIVTNKCPYTVWPAIFTDLNVGTAKPDFPTGWVAPPGNTVSFNVPNNWKAGRIWARTECNFDVNPGPNSCITGGCNGGLLCDPHSGTGVPPATLAEWTLEGDGNKDFYDVSAVDGSSVPLSITNNQACPVAACTVDLNLNCPAQLIKKDSAENSANCCTGDHAVPATCPTSGVQFYSYFKTACPNAYAYAYDEASQSALFTCDSNKLADYTLTFCP